jgi:hypothetical protein
MLTGIRLRWMGDGCLLGLCCDRFAFVLIVVSSLSIERVGFLVIIFIITIIGTFVSDAVIS